MNSGKNSLLSSKQDYDTIVKAMEFMTESLRNEGNKISAALNVIESDGVDKKEKIKEIWAPDTDDLLPETTDECIELYIRLLKILLTKQNNDAKEYRIVIPLLRECLHVLK